MRRRGYLVKRIHRDRPEYAKLHGHRLLERGAALRLFHVMRERRPWQSNAGALGLGCGRLRLRAADRGDAAFAARDALRRLMQIADRAFAADRAVIGVLWRDAEAAGQQLFRIAVAPAQEIDDVERADVAEQFAAAVRFGAPQRGFQQRERSRPSAISFGRSVISPTPTMTGMRSSEMGEVGSVIFLISLSQHSQTSS